MFFSGSFPIIRLKTNGQRPNSSNQSELECLWSNSVPVSPLSNVNAALIQGLRLQSMRHSYVTVI